MFVYRMFGIPVLNMSYSGAIKSTVYGFYLRFVSGRFTVYSWRLLGILFVAVGLFAFYSTAGVWLPRKLRVIRCAHPDGHVGASDDKT